MKRRNVTCRRCGYRDTIEEVIKHLQICRGTDALVFQLATQLYFDLPFWKRRRIRKYYDSNNWDVTGEWKKCVHQARRMAYDSDIIIHKLTDERQN